MKAIFLRKQNNGSPFLKYESTFLTLIWHDTFQKSPDTGVKINPLVLSMAGLALLCFYV